MTIYYSDPVSGNDANGGSLGSPWKTFNPYWSVAAPDDTLLLLDGTFAGSTNAMIQPPHGTVDGGHNVLTVGLSGTSGHPITIAALNDGQVFIDGETARRPMYFNGNSFFEIDGINFGNSPIGGDGGGVVQIDDQSNYNTMTRCIAWNADPHGNTQVFQINYANHNVLEDCAAFGTGRKMYSIFHSIGYTLRRCWGQWSGNDSTSGPQSVYTNYSSYDGVMENVIATWDASLGIGPDNPYGMLGAFQMTGATDIPGGPGTINSNCIYNGCLAYQLGSQSGFMYLGALLGGALVDGVTFNNCATYMGKTGGDASPSANLYNLQVSGEFGNSIPALAHNFTNCTLINVESVFENISVLDTSHSFAEADWNRVNIKTGPTPFSVYGSQSLWNNDGTVGALIDFRLVNGTKTTTPLFPWPMEDRIFAAMTFEGSLTPRSVNTDVYSIWGVPNTVVPGGVAPIDDFDSYTTGHDLEGA